MYLSFFCSTVEYSTLSPTVILFSGQPKIPNTTADYTFSRRVETNTSGGILFFLYEKPSIGRDIIYDVRERQRVNIAHDSTHSRRKTQVGTKQGASQCMHAACSSNLIKDHIFSPLC
mmetsp:Transcript_31930/g.32350  ORF Transcript_31930/g.32350 Transcript_31930/m.32350 type:complete len:117 (-) Transcript_31930:408-758(-)